MKLLLLTLGVSLVVLAGRVLAGEEPREPLCISGIYPSLAALSGAKSECGVGAVVPWAGSLWFITYPAHYGDGKLYQVDERLALHLRPESIGGTHAGRLVHRESNQLIIGPYFIDQGGTIKSSKLHARITAVMRHLADPANKVYMFDMEGGFFEVDVHTQEFTNLFTLQQRGVTGTHGKGGTTGQGRVVVANNGRGGALAEWDGKSERWTLVQHDKFCEVTGPGGILGAPDDQSPDTPIWSNGWDLRSLILKVLDKGVWHTYRFPNSTYTHQPDHGWFTEWPRIREVEPGRYMMDFPSMFYDFPKDFRPGRTAGFRPIATHLRMVPDFCFWRGRLVLAADDTSVMGNPLGGQPQSNLWFGTRDDLAKFGRPAGWGGPWRDDDVKAGAPSDPYLIDGFDKRVLHLAHDSASEVTFTLETDAAGDGTWAKSQAIKVPPHGYVYHIFPADFRATWIRLTADKDCKATAYFHYSPAGREPEGGALFASLPAIGDDAPRLDGALLPHADRLWFLASGGALYEIDKDVQLRLRKEDPADQLGAEARALLASVAPKKQTAPKLGGGIELSLDDASAIAKVRGRTFRLPKADPAYDKAPDHRGVREVVTERYLMNCAGTFYEVPRELFQGIRPIATHGKWIADFCTWRGLLVMAGDLASAKPDGHFFGDGEAGLWFGAVDDLWRLGKPRGVGGPWRKTPVKAGLPSEPYLMTGFDRKSVELSHDDAGEVDFTLEVQVVPGGAWYPYSIVKVPSGQTTRHEFPDGFSAHWVRVTASRDCDATAWFVYE